MAENMVCTHLAHCFAFVSGEIAIAVLFVYFGVFEEADRPRGSEQSLRIHISFALIANVKSQCSIRNIDLETVSER